MQLFYMINYWIIISKRYNFDLNNNIKYIKDNELWDFVGSNSDQSRTPSHALELKEDDKVLFYLARKDREGNPLSSYPYPIFFAKATLKSKFIDISDKDKREKDKDGNEINKFVRLKDIIIFKNRHQVIKPMDRYKIGAAGPTMLVRIENKELYDDVCRKSGVVP